MGILIGFIASFLLKKMSEIQSNSSRIQIGVLLTFPYFSYLVSHISGLSAIVVIFFIGISFAVYAKPFINSHAEEVIHHVYDEVATLAEGIVFVFIGMAFYADHPYE